MDLDPDRLSAAAPAGAAFLTVPPAATKAASYKAWQKDFADWVYRNQVKLEIPEARKLLKLTVSLGGDERRTVFAGIKSAYQPQDLVGRLVVVVANLAPRQMKFGLSQGMVTAAGSGGADIFLLSPDSGAKPGQRVH